MKKITITIEQDSRKVIIDVVLKDGAAISARAEWLPRLSKDPAKKDLQEKDFFALRILDAMKNGKF